MTRQIIFQYPDGRHDAEGVAVDVDQQKILIVTKRDNPPLVFELPLIPENRKQIQTAELVSSIDHLPPPTHQDRIYPYGEFRSHPTAIDISADSATLVLLTYKHAYLFQRCPWETWATSLSQPPQLITLPLPEKTPGLLQREAICFVEENRF